MNETQPRSFVAVDDLAEYQTSLAGPDWLVSVRSAAAARFSERTWPTTEEEEWRRTSLRTFDFTAYDAAPVVAGERTSVAEAEPSEGHAGVLAYRNGSLTRSWVSPKATDAGVVFGELVDLMADGAIPSERAVAAIRSTIERTSDESDNRLIDWHIAMMQGAAVLYVPANVSIAEPFEIDLEFEGDEVVHAPHVIVYLERGADASVIRRLHSAESGELLIVDVGELIVEEGARLRHLNLQRLNDESLAFTFDRGNVGRDGHVHRTEAAFGCDFVKSRYVSELTGPGADAVLNGLYFAVRAQHMDLRTVQRHRARHSTSRAFYRGTARDESHVIYQGLIRVDPEAVGTDAYLTNKNLILSPEARADSIPSLNISTDEVRCSHGSTTGKLDAEQIFYLQCRGYDEALARRTLVEAFYEDLINQTPRPVHDELRELIAQRIADGV